MLGNSNAGLDNRFAQFQGQGQPGGGGSGGFPGLGGNMQALQSLQAGNFGLQNPLQGGRCATGAAAMGLGPHCAAWLPAAAAAGSEEGSPSHTFAAAELATALSITPLLCSAGLD